MLNVSQVWTRLKKIDSFKGMNESDFRIAYYGQTFTPPSGGAVTAAAGAKFPTGAVLIGISASAFVPGVAASGQSSRNRQLFQIDFSYTGGEGLVIDGPLMADALLGGGDADNFPAKELIIAPNQQINCRCANLTTGALTVQVVYTGLVYRFAT